MGEWDSERPQACKPLFCHNSQPEVEAEGSVSKEIACEHEKLSSVSKYPCKTAGLGGIHLSSERWGDGDRWILRGHC